MELYIILVERRSVLETLVHDQFSNLSVLGHYEQSY